MKDWTLFWVFFMIPVTGCALGACAAKMEDRSAYTACYEFLDKARAAINTETSGEWLDLYSECLIVQRLGEKIEK